MLQCLGYKNLQSTQGLHVLGHLDLSIIYALEVEFMRIRSAQHRATLGAVSVWAGGVKWGPPKPVNEIHNPSMEVAEPQAISYQY